MGIDAVIYEIDTDEDLQAVVDLCNRFLAWTKERYRDEPWTIERYYPEREWAALMARLALVHAAPDGAIVLARIGGRPAGCVMLAKLEPGICEMKRLYVEDFARGAGLARKLCGFVMKCAQDRGYRLMRLETGLLQPEAVSLYESLGFTHREPYILRPDDADPSVIAMERGLASPVCP